MGGFWYRDTGSYLFVVDTIFDAGGPNSCGKFRGQEVSHCPARSAGRKFLEVEYGQEVDILAHR